MRDLTRPKATSDVRLKVDDGSLPSAMTELSFDGLVENLLRMHIRSLINFQIVDDGVPNNTFRPQWFKIAFESKDYVLDAETAYLCLQLDIVEPDKTMRITIGIGAVDSGPLYYSRMNPDFVFMATTDDLSVRVAVGNMIAIILRGQLRLLLAVQLWQGCQGHAQFGPISETTPPAAPTTVGRLAAEPPIVRFSLSLISDRAIDGSAP